MSKELSVEEALTDLEKMFPDYMVKIGVRSFRGERIWIIEAGFDFKGKKLETAMAQVRQWKESQKDQAKP